MKISHATLGLFAAVSITGCATPGEPRDKALAVANLAMADGSSAGTARLAIGRDNQLHLVIEASNIIPGPHGVHIHAAGKCEAPGFTSAAGHLNPQGHQHGSLNSAGPHLGDMPIPVAGAGGSAKLDLNIPGGTGATSAAILDADGSAIVIHAGADDYRPDPSGNSGARIACGVLVSAR